MTSTVATQATPPAWRPDGRWLLARILQIPVYAAFTLVMRHWGRYRIADVQALRAQYRSLTKEGGPLIIAANHLTFIDSCLIVWALGSNGWYALNFAKFSWNLPAGDFFKKRRRYRIVAAMTKCIFVHRDGSKEHKDAVIRHCAALSRAGEVLTIFPEGRRSRSGRFERDTLSFGTAKLITMLNEPCRVLCCYLRSDKQAAHSSYPPRGSAFRLLTDVVTITPRGDGRDGYQTIMDRIGDSISTLEARYFSSPS